VVKKAGLFSNARGPVAGADQTARDPPEIIWRYERGAHAVSASPSDAISYSDRPRMARRKFVASGD
jgi:hypothetical protein